MNKLWASNRTRFGVLLLLILAGMVAWLIFDTALQAQSNDDRVTLDKSKTLSGITVQLSESTRTTDGLELGYTYQTSSEDLVVHLIGVPEIRSRQKVIDASKGVVDNRNNFTISIPWKPGEAGFTDVADVDLGSFIVSKPSISGSTQLSLGADYATDITTESSSINIPLNANLDVSGRRYLVSKMTLFGNEDGAGFSSFLLTLSPKNGAAEGTEVASGGVANVTLTDDQGNSYQWTRTRTSWNKDPDSRTVAWQQLSFDGAPPGLASTLTLSVTGGGEIVGPFVFEDVRLISGDGR